MWLFDSSKKRPNDASPFLSHAPPVLARPRTAAAPCQHREAAVDKTSPPTTAGRTAAAAALNPRGTARNARRPQGGNGQPLIAPRVPHVGELPRQPTTLPAFPQVLRVPVPSRFNLVLKLGPPLAVPHRPLGRRSHRPARPRRLPPATLHAYLLGNVPPPPLPRRVLRLVVLYPPRGTTRNFLPTCRPLTLPPVSRPSRRARAFPSGGWSAGGCCRMTLTRCPRWPSSSICCGANPSASATSAGAWTTICRRAATAPPRPSWTVASATAFCNRALLGWPRPSAKEMCR